MMTNHIYKLVELAGSSPTSIEDAVQTAITRASKTLRNIHWFQIVETRGSVASGKIEHWQVLLKVGFTLDD
jgi:dodecin